MSTPVALADPVRVDLRDLLECSTEVFRNWEAAQGVVMFLCGLLHPGSGLARIRDVMGTDITFCWIEIGGVH